MYSANKAHVLELCGSCEYICEDSAPAEILYHLHFIMCPCNNAFAALQKHHDDFQIIKNSYTPSCNQIEREFYVCMHICMYVCICVCVIMSANIIISNDVLFIRMRMDSSCRQYQ
jgi:hypothetical protein